MISYLKDLSEVIKTINGAELEEFLQTVRYRTQVVGGTLYVGGNGGSYSVAEHWGVDLLKAGHIKARTLGTNPALLTAMANDAEYSVGLSTELAVWARPGDMVVALSCSGKSNNIAALLKTAQRSTNVASYLITGPKSPQYLGTKVIHIGSDDYGILEDVFSAIGHWLTRELS